ncbi:MAG TPA: peptidyl-prolyl cis-trans isomerase [Bryobacteraceae bacterium]|nr:peptidyl-prolyl cis-trans isomerase [Bryobacteraceae bacterium]
MFDLFRSRAKAVRILLGAMLTLVALSMLVYLIPGAGAPTVDRSDQIVAEIGKQPVTVPEVELQIRTALQNEKVPQELVDIYIPQIIDQSIAERAMAYEAQRLGFQVSDQDLANLVRSLQFGNLPPDQYRNYVEQQFNMTVGDFENNLRLRAYLEDLQTIALEGVVVTPVEVEAAYRQQNEKIKFEYILVDPSKMSGELKPTDAELKTYFESNRAMFPMVETRDAQLIVVDQAKVAETIPIPDSQVQSYYNSHRDQFQTPERVHARHILLSTAGKSEAEKPQIKAKADDLLKQLRAGADFGKLAEKNSEDPGSASKGGDLGWVVRGQMVKEFEDATFALKPKEISNVITTQYGFHIIQVLEKEAAHLRTLEEVKPEILAALRSQTVFDRMQTLADQARAELVKAPQNGQQIADKLGVQFVRVTNFKPGNPIPELGTDAQTGNMLGSMTKGEISQIQQAGNKLVIVELTSINPPHPGEFSEVAVQVRSNYVAQRASAAAAEKVKKVTELLKSNGGDLAATAKSAGLGVQTADFFSRSGAAEGIGPGQVLKDAFEKPDGTLIGPVLIAGQTIFGKVLARQPPDMSKLAEQRDSIVTQIKAQKAQGRQSLLQDSVVTSLIQQGKIKKHQDVINRLIARYRSS